MTAAPITATCTAQVTDPTNTWACTSHLGIYHVADTGDGGLRLWLDPDDCGFAPWEAPMIARIRGEIDGPTPVPAVALVVEAARNYVTRLRHTPRWEERLTPEARQLVAAIDTLDAGGGA